MIVLEIPTAPPSRNQLDKMHWAARARLATVFKREVAQFSPSMMRAVVLETRGKYGRAKSLGFVLKNRAKGHRFVRIVRRYRSARYELDHDNLVGGCKPLVDALVKVGLIEDDTPGLVTVTYEQERGTGCRVEVRVADSGGGCHA